MHVRVQSGPREARFPRGVVPPGVVEGDDALGLSIWRVLAEALSRGSPPPAVLLLTDEEAHLIDIGPLLKEGESLHGRAVSALASVAGVEAMACVGLLTRRQRGLPPTRFAVAFVEWPDGRWWLARRALVEEGGRLVVDALAEVDVERAVDGASKPGGLGGWFRRVRMEGLRVVLSRDVEN